MSTFNYVAQDRKGKTRKGTLEVESAQALVKQLRGEGLFVSEYQEAVAVKRSGKFKLSEITITKAKVKTRDLMLFSRQFASMIGAGLHLVECLEILEQQSENPTLKEAIAGVKMDVMEGKSLAEGFAKYPKVFNNLYVSMMEAAQTTGSFAGPLDDLATMLEKTEEIQRKVKGALMMPTFTMAFAVLINLLLIKFMVPTFVMVFGDTELPKPTQVLVSISNMLQGVQSLILVGIIVVITFSTRKFVQTSRGRRIWDRLKLKLPIFGTIILKRSITLFSRTLSLLLGNGVEYLEALSIVANVSDNQIIREVLEDARESISRGEDLSDAFVRSDVFPPLVTQLIGSGVKTGKVPEMLGHISKIYEAEVTQSVEALTEALTPILTIILGVLIGGVLIGLYLPVFGIGEQLMK